MADGGMIVKPSPTFGRLIGGGGLGSHRKGLRTSPSFLCFEKPDSEGGGTITYEKYFDKFAGDSYTQYPDLKLRPNTGSVSDDIFGYPVSSRYSPEWWDLWLDLSPGTFWPVYQYGYSNGSSVYLSLCAWKGMSFGPVKVTSDVTLQHIDLADESFYGNSYSTDEIPVNITSVTMKGVAATYKPYSGIPRDIWGSIFVDNSGFDDSGYVDLVDSVKTTHKITGGYALLTSKSGETVTLRYGEIPEPGEYEMRMNVVCELSGTFKSPVDWAYPNGSRVSGDYEGTSSFDPAYALFDVTVPITVSKGGGKERFVASVPESVEAKSDVILCHALSVHQLYQPTYFFMMIYPFTCEFSLKDFPKLFVT